MEGRDVMEECDEIAEDSNVKQEMRIRSIRWNEKRNTAHRTCPSPC